MIMDGEAVSGYTWDIRSSHHARQSSQVGQQPGGSPAEGSGSGAERCAWAGFGDDGRQRSVGNRPRQTRSFQLGMDGCGSASSWTRARTRDGGLGTRRRVRDHRRRMVEGRTAATEVFRWRLIGPSSSPWTAAKSYGSILIPCGERSKLARGPRSCCRKQASTRSTGARSFVRSVPAVAIGPLKSLSQTACRSEASFCSIRYGPWTDSPVVSGQSALSQRRFWPAFVSSLAA